MNNELVQHRDSTPSVSQGGLGREQVELLKQTIAKGATDEELQFFIQVVNRTGLDPFSRQIYMVKRWDSQAKKNNMVIQMGIDGFRAIAAEDPDYDGSSEAVFGALVEHTYNGTKYSIPESATVEVYSKGSNRPTTATVYWDEFFPGEKQGYMWLKMPRQMLAKTAEAQALRKRYPKKLSGFYTDDEMAKEDTQYTAEEIEEKKEPVRLNSEGQPYASLKQIQIMYIRAGEKGYNHDDVHKIIKAKYGVTTAKDLTRAQIEECIIGFDSVAQKSAPVEAKTTNKAVQEEIEELETEAEVKAIKPSAVQAKLELTDEDKASINKEIEDFKNSQEKAGDE